MKTSPKQSHFGFSLTELLIALSIFAILAVFAVPTMNDSLSDRDLENATMTLMQSIKKAKKVAYAESTFVDVSIVANIITIRKLNNGDSQIITLPNRINVQNDLMFRFNTIGNIFLFTNVNAAAPLANPTVVNTNITLESISNNASSVVSVSPIGHVTS